eukprot:UN25382
MKLQKEQKRLIKRTKNVGVRATRPSAKWDIEKLPDYLRPCAGLLQTLYNSPNIEVFTQPVNTRIYTNYLRVVHRPMCLNDVRQNLFTRKYLDYRIFLKDINTIWQNAKKFNPIANRVHTWAQQFENKVRMLTADFARRCKTFDQLKMENKIPSDLHAPDSASGINTRELKGIRSLSRAELIQIEEHFPELPEDILNDLIELIPTDDNDEAEVSVDIESLPVQIQWKIFTVIKNHFNLPEPGNLVESVESEPVKSEEVETTVKNPFAQTATTTQNPFTSVKRK